jgi:hypothetical protein
MSLFDLYWRVLGLPLSRAKGFVTDAVPFSLVEVSLWMGAAATIAWIALWFLRGRKGLPARRGARWTAFALGPAFLAVLSLGQGAFPFAVAPSALRAPLSERLSPAPLDSAAFRAWVAERESRLRRRLGDSAGWRSFQALSETRVLAACDTSLNAVLRALGLPPGRTVRRFKDMGPWTTAMGLVYGGPAFHDPLFGEIGIIALKNYPVSHFWRMIAACHETAHAKGFTREMDAEILTQLALARVPDPRYEALADVHFLRKAGARVAWPESLLAEAAREGERRERVDAGRPVLRALRAWARGANLRNSPKKYGERASGEAWNPRHPFYATVRAAEARVPGAARPEEGAKP